MPIIMRIVVVLPAPFGPRKPKTSPFSIESSRSRTAVNSPYFLLSCWKAIIWCMARFGCSRKWKP